MEGDNLMQMTAKEFSISQNMPLNTVKRYCKNGIFKCCRIGRRYCIDVDYAVNAIKEMQVNNKLDNHKIINKRRKGRIRTVTEFHAALKALREA